MVNSNDEQGRMADAIVALNAQFALVAAIQSFDDWKSIMVGEIDRLIQMDFSRLVSILYRLDVSEQKLERLLKENPAANAAEIIANLVIERQVEKLKTRMNQSDKKEDIPEDERW
jgi:hypothetical protein